MVGDKGQGLKTAGFYHELGLCSCGRSYHGRP
jgi:hypothetical protein